MTPLHQQHSSFVIRIWWEQADAAADGRPIWRGWVQHVRSGETAYVQDLEGLLGFIERWTGPLTSGGVELQSGEQKASLTKLAP